MQHRFDTQSTIVAVLVVGFLLWLRFRSRRIGVDRSAHGTSGWATDWALKRARAFLPGLVIGRSAESGRLISLPKSVCHVAVYAPTGAGKFVSLLAPWLLTTPRGCSRIIIDPKAEAFRFSHRALVAMGFRVVRLDPFGVATECGPADTWNVLDTVDDSPASIDESRALAEAMTIRATDGDKDPHWNDQCANVLTGLLSLLLATAEGEERSLGSLRDLLASPGAQTNCASHLMRMGGVYARLGGVIAALEDKERAGVTSTCHRQTAWLDSLPILASTQRSTWDARSILDGNVVVFVVLPHHAIESQARWMRLVVTSLIRLIGREGMAKGKLCELFIDEAGTALGGHLPAVEQALVLLRSAGLRLRLFFQSTGQTKEVFRDKSAVLTDNCDATLFFGINSLETAEHVSKMLGSYTRAVENYSENETRSWNEDSLGNPGVNVSRNSGFSVSLHARELLKPDEVLNAPPDVMFAFVRGVGAPICCKLVRWYQQPALVKRQKAR